MVNNKQAIGLIIGVALLILAELFPPWEFIDNNSSARCWAGYHFYNSPPQIKNKEELLKCFPYYSKEQDIGGTIRFVRVKRVSILNFVQRIILSWLTVSFLICFWRYESRRIVNLVIIFGVVGLLVGFLGILILWLEAL